MSREMKDSGVEWIGEIPENWDVLPIKRNYRIVAGATPKSDKPENWDGEIPWITPSDYKTEDKYILSGKKSITEKGYNSCSTTMVPANSIIFSKRAPVGTVAISANELCTNQGCLSCVPLNKSNSVFGYYSMIAGKNAFEMAALGTTFMEISADAFANMKLPYCGITEQQQIVHFLDRKCTAIDTAIEKTKKSIEKLEEYKKAVITKAVTNGIDPNAKMKDSGVEWCPQIPEHWSVVNPKALFSQRTERILPGDKQLTASQEHGIIYQDEYTKATGSRVVAVIRDFSILKHVEPNDFVISMRSFQGGLEYSEKRGCISSAYVMLIPNTKYVYPPFYRWFFKSSKYINALQSTSNFVRDGQAMRYSHFIQIPLFVIPLTEQKQIANYLESKVNAIMALILKKQMAITKWEEYKKSLIYYAVTGKIDCKNEVI